MNAITQIQIRDMPLCIREGFPSLKSTLMEDSSIEDGNLMSEVGRPQEVQLKSFRRKFLSYFLRGERKNLLPGHVFGKAHLGESFSAFLPRIFSIPAVGANSIIQPVVTPWQSSLIGLYQYISADVTWILHTPSPIGTSVLLEVLAPELDTTTSTRSVRWRPAGLNTVSVTCPWSSDVTVVPITTGRFGQSGGAIRIRTVEDNSTEQVNTPLQITVYCCVHNINLSGLLDVNAPGVQVTGLNFKPQTIPAIRENSAETSVEVQGEGVGDVAKVAATEGTATTDLQPKVEKPAPKPEKPRASSSSTKNNVGAVNQRWFELITITLDSTRINQWINITIDPSKIGTKGEGLKLAFQRNLWVAGSGKIGYSRMLKVKAIVTRPPQISGLIEFCDSFNNSSRVFVEFGGTLEMDLIPRKFSGVDTNVRPRHYNSPWLRTDEALHAFRYRLTAFNRTSEIAEIKIRLFVKPGETTFHTPRKPLRAATSLDWLADQWEQYIDPEEIPLIRENSDNTSHSDEQINSTEEPADYIAPPAGLTAEGGEVEAGEADLEELDQDDFGVEIWRGKLKNGEPLVIPLNLSVTSDLTNPQGESTLQEKFSRFAHILPAKIGNLGPTLGTYTVMARLPTTVAGNIAHIALPQDVVDETVSFAFGLTDILSYATSALTGIGGPLLSGAINAGKSLIGKVFNGLGSKPADANSSDTAHPLGISGPIDVARFIKFLKPVSQNLTEDPTFANLLLMARDFYDSSTGFAVPEIPISVWVKMDRVKVERNVFDREVVPIESISNNTVIPYDRVASVLRRFGTVPNLTQTASYQHECAYKFIAYLVNLDIEAHQPIILEDIISLVVDATTKEAIDSYIDAGPSASLASLRTTLRGVGSA